jgi:hypothetical protein
MHLFREEAKSMKHGVYEKRMVAARLQAAGIPLPVEDHSATQPDLLVESLKGSRVFDRIVGCECVLNVRISNNSYGNLKVDKLRGHLLEVDWLLTFQGDPKEHNPECKTYRMPSGRSLRRDSVLNHRLGGEIAPGTSMEGKLLAFSFNEKIPEDYPHGLSVPLEVILTDQYGRKHASIIEVLVDRTATMPKPQAFSRVGRGLYDGCPLETPKFDYRAPSEHPVGNANAGESAEKPTEQMKRIIELLGRADLDAMLAVGTSTMDEAELNLNDDRGSRSAR